MSINNLKLQYLNAVSLKMAMLILVVTGMNFIDFGLCKLGNHLMAHELFLLQKV